MDEKNGDPLRLGPRCVTATQIAEAFSISVKKARQLLALYQVPHIEALGTRPKKYDYKTINALYAAINNMDPNNDGQPDLFSKSKQE